jgi:hypothetical protein
VAFHSRFQTDINTQPNSPMLTGCAEHMLDHVIHRPSVVDDVIFETEIAAGN